MYISLVKWFEMALKSDWLIASALIIVIACSALFIGWQYQVNSSAIPDKDTVFQLAAFNTFSTGQYDGFMAYSELEQHGDFGIGTFDGLNGEMLAFDGIFYQIPSDGNPIVVEATQTSPHATVTYFDADLSYTVTGLNYTGLKSYLDTQLGTAKDVIYAIKVSGDFSFVQARSPTKQAEPFPNLTDALKTQSIFNFTDVSATAVGYWFPSSMNGVDPAGYHLHIISADKTAGGHLLECQIENATIQVDVIKNYTLVLP
jgi:acetolactate decarboxylase